MLDVKDSLVKARDNRHHGAGRAGRAGGGGGHPDPAQRFHDGLQEAMRRLVAAGLLPERAGQPVKAWAHVSLAELRALDDGSAAGAGVGRGDGRAVGGPPGGGVAGRQRRRRLAGRQAARALACDASVVPVVTGGIDPGALDDLVALACSTPTMARTADPRRGSPTARTRPASPRARGLKTHPASQARPRTRPAARPGPAAAAHRPGPGDAPARDHRQNHRFLTALYRCL